ncbi:hypothetical protein [Nonomuraea guangzhouensis]|uniref:VWA domain-containing protein n=1 Tax=Nonomuraea guangzhouensis TaxID=1291555 RepID=A0ABW4G3T0_9ACTN|nr:hypothetical protein [Nonomuraea guangzhouensis]
MTAPSQAPRDDAKTGVTLEAKAFFLARIYQAARDLYVTVVNLPRSLTVSLVTLIVGAMVAGVAWFVVGVVLPQYAPTYKTQFLIDATSEPGDITRSLMTVVGSAGDRDALALRRFGGECGADDNTTQLVSFGTGNRQDIKAAAGQVRAGGQSTLLRGIVAAVEDFAAPFAQRAKQVNRVIVISNHGADACDADTAFVEREIRERVASAGLNIQFRVVGYRVPRAQREALERIADASGATAPLYAGTPAQLDSALDWFTNVEPVLENARRVITTLNATIDRVKAGLLAIRDGRLDVAERELRQAGTGGVDTELDDLAGRAKTPAARDLHARAADLRTRQGRLLDGARRLLDSARAGSPPELTSLERAIADYNDRVKHMNDAIKALRATAPASTS